jgi:hypothetical protein
MRLPVPKKIIIDDSTPVELQDTMSILAGTLNPFMSDVYGILNQGINQDNLESRMIKIEVKTNGTGAIIAPIDVATGLNRLPYGHTCIDVKMTDNNSLIPNITGIPYLLYTPNSISSLRISKILNLGVNSKYTITVMFI